MRHEQYIQSIQQIVISRLSPPHSEKVSRAKLAYGFGKSGLRGVTIYSAWANGHGPNDPTDGKPLVSSGLSPLPKIGLGKGTVIGPCTAGIGTKGGKSRGVGSGSRLRKYSCEHGQIIRAATDELNATCNICSTLFKQV